MLEYWEVFLLSPNKEVVNFNGNCNMNLFLIRHLLTEYLGLPLVNNYKLFLLEAFFRKINNRSHFIFISLSCIIVGWFTNFLFGVMWNTNIFCLRYSAIHFHRCYWMFASDVALIIHNLVPAIQYSHSTKFEADGFDIF